MASRSIISALNDPVLFRPLFPEATWRIWRAFLTALFGLPLSDEQFASFQHHTQRTNAPTKPFKEACLICGRRSGKSRILALIAVYLACFRDYRPYVAPGEAPTIAVIAADRKQARVILGYALGLLRSVALLEPMIQDSMVESIKLTNGVVIEVHTGHIGTPRGRTFAAVLCDEIAFWQDDNSANPDAEVIASVRPALATIPGSILLMASSPYARRGVLYDTFKRHFGRDNSRTLVWRGASHEMNLALDYGVIEEALEEDPDSAKAEYLAEFRNDIASFVSREAVEACIAPNRRELPFDSHHTYFAFVDPSGGSGDAMTLAIGHRVDSRGVLDAVREVRPPFSPEAVVSEFGALLRTYGISTVKGDRYAGEWPRERFRVHGITYKTADRTKSEYYQNLLPLLNSGNVELLDIPRLGSQLSGLERRTSRGGRDSIDHAPGAHDDIANAVAGLLVGLCDMRSTTQAVPHWQSLANINIWSR